MATLETWGAEQLSDTVRLLNRVSPFDHFPTTHAREAVFGDPDYNPDLLLRMIDGDKVAAVAAGVVRKRLRRPEDPPVGFVKLLAVAPEYQRQHVGTALLDALEQRFRDRGANAVLVFGDSPAYLRPGVDFRLTPLVCFLQKRGYASRRHAVNMDVDLARANLETAEDERRLSGLGITIRRLETGDAAAFEAYMLENWSWNWLREACSTLKRDLITTHIALRDGKIVGFASANASGPGQFGPMGTHPDLRRHGVGGVVLKRCLADLRDQDYPIGEIQWVGPIGFYARQVGATLTRCFFQFERVLE
ncbi:MAG TPA: GNAT family N-acetyltransferase [Chloroflexota bacterium]|nr:GNAT family N-acetyltransferase [Chloroflexota bacterium]